MTTPYLEQRFAKDPAFVARAIVDEMVLVPIRQTAGDLDSIYTLNAVGSRIWELVDGQRRGADIRDVLVAEFDVTVAKAEADLVEFLQLLEQVGAVKAV